MIKIYYKTNSAYQQQRFENTKFKFSSSLKTRDHKFWQRKKRIKRNNKMANLKALPAKDLEIESRLLSTPPLEAVKSALKKVRLKV